MSIRKVCIVTATRAEYGLLYWLMKELEADVDVELQVIATGMHLNKEYGSTYQEIEKDFKINKKIEMDLSSDTNLGICKSMGLAQISFAEVYEEIKPDIIVVLGDRYEIFSAVSSAMMLNIPLAHIHGGESSEGLIDEPIRHCITKMSHLHFTATEEYKNKVIQLGEQPNRVFNFGGMGIENIKRLKLLSRDEFEKSIGMKLNKKNILVTFHPVTFEDDSFGENFNELLMAIDNLKDTNIIFTKSNSDANGKIINRMIDQYVAENNSKSKVFASLGQLRYLSAMQYVDAVVGNSSSGLIEAPSFKIGTINIGDRQRGRQKARSIIDCKPDKASIKKALQKIYSSKFKEYIKKTKNPYGDGCASKKIVRVLKKTKLKNIIKKEFFKLGSKQ